MEPNRRRRLARGFTLIELLVVVAVISILAALLMPVVLKGMVAGMATNCKSNLRQIGDATQLYRQNNGNVFLRHGQNRYQNDPQYSGEVVRPGTALDHFLAKESEVWICPADAATKGRGASWWLASYPYNGLLSNVPDTDIECPSKIVTIMCGPQDARWTEFKPPHGHDDSPYVKPTLTQYNRHQRRLAATYYDLHVELLRAPETAREDFDPKL